MHILNRYRRSKAILLSCKCGDEQYQKAIEDLEHVLTIEPTNTEVKKDYENLKKNLRNYKKKISSKPEIAEKPSFDIPESKLAEEAPELNILNE